MKNPFKYRPTDADVKGDWEDNAVSNFLAWASQVFIEPWCNTPEHWTSKISGYFWAECPCCLFFRGVLIGLLISTIPIAILAWAMYVFWM
jgi:hypothetical protein